MKYPGGKTRLVSKIKPHIMALGNDKETYWEPFVGGGSVFAAVAPEFKESIASDIHPDLILMWQAAAKGWEPPDAISETEYASLKESAESSALRGFAGFACSFGAKWFGGYARCARGEDYCGEGHRGVLKKAPAFRDATIARMPYDGLKPDSGFAIYCDPPYAGTLPYKGAPAFDHVAFWETARGWSKTGASVLVSEYSAPDDFIQIAEFPLKQNISRAATRPDTIERLFIHESQRKQIPA